MEILKGAVFHAENTLNTVGHGQLEAPLEASRCILVPASKRTTDVDNLIHLETVAAQHEKSYNIEQKKRRTS